MSDVKMETNEHSSDTSGPSTDPPLSITQSRRSVEGALHVLETDHEAVLYHGDDVGITKSLVPKEEEEEDESFFEVEVNSSAIFINVALAHDEVTLNDVKSMFKDLQRRREALEDAPFKGQKLRALEKEQAVLNSLHDHPNTAIRIRFPDRLVLQGIFRTSDTVGSIMWWLRQFLHNPLLEFYLFTAPPKKVLQKEVKLVDEGLVAMVVIYFGCQEMPENNQVLKQELIERLSDPDQAFELAKNKLKVRKRENDEEEEVKASTETQLKDHPAQSSNQSNSQQPVRRPVDKGKVPKWFKMSK